MEDDQKLPATDIKLYVGTKKWDAAMDFRNGEDFLSTEWKDISASTSIYLVTMVGN